MTGSRIAVGTVFAKNYLALARVLAESFSRYHAEVDFFGALADSPDGWFDPAAESFPVIALEDLPVPEPRQMAFRYSRLQISVAAKAYLLQYLLDRGFDAALFLDVDIEVTGDVSDLLDRTTRSAITIVPHLLAPLEGADRAARELNILQSGVFNGGVIGVRESATARRFLAWWQDRLYLDCRHSLQEGLHYDQRWLDLVPSYFDDVGILRDPAYNVAHWNLPERASTPCRLFHFSGYEPDRPHLVTRYSDRLGMTGIGEQATHFIRYQQALEDAGWRESRAWPYAYDRWDNGVRIPGVARRLYGDLGSQVDRFGDPFATTLGSYFAWLNAAVDGDRGLTNLLAAVYAQRPDVQAAFPDPRGADLDAFRTWALSAGAAEHAIPADLLSS
jgi:hypothetical protein